jgi:hypothetical protein
LQHKEAFFKPNDKQKEDIHDSVEFLDRLEQSDLSDQALFGENES